MRARACTLRKPRQQQLMPSPNTGSGLLRDLLIFFGAVGGFVGGFILLQWLSPGRGGGASGWVMILVYIYAYSRLLRYLINKSKAPTE